MTDCRLRERIHSGFLLPVIAPQSPISIKVAKCSSHIWEMFGHTLFLCTWILLALCASHAMASVTFRQAWQQYCNGRQGECSGAHVPQKGYLISLPDDVEKRDYLLPQLKTLGLDIENVNGILSDQVSLSLILQRDRYAFCFRRSLPRTRSHVCAVA